MKSTMLAFLLIAVSVQLSAQLPWCFSQQCEQTQVSAFKNPTQAPFYKPLVTAPAYTPVSPLAPSFSTRQFFSLSRFRKTLHNPFLSYRAPQTSPNVALGVLHPSPAPLSKNSLATTNARSGMESTHSFATGAQGFSTTGNHFR